MVRSEIYTEQGGKMIMAKFVQIQANRMARVSQITTVYNHGEQKSISKNENT